MPNPTPFKDLAGYMDKQVIACIEGRITKVQEKIASGTGQYGDWSMQFGTMVDASNVSHNWTITDSNLFLSQQDLGATIRYESMPQSKGGPAGVTMSIRNDKQGNPQRSIKIDNRASVNRSGGNASAPSQSAPTQGGAVSAQSEGVFDQSPVRERVHGYMEILKEVSAQYKHLQSEAAEGTIPKLSAADIKDIATHISMTYRGDKGSYAKPIFQKPQQEKAKAPEDDLDYSPAGGGSEDLSGEDLPFSPAWKSLGSGVF